MFLVWVRSVFRETMSSWAISGPLRSVPSSRSTSRSRSLNGSIVHLKGHGMVKVFRIVTADGDTEHWAMSNLDLDSTTRTEMAHQVWTIEVYHRGLKQFCGVERAQVRSARAQRNHIGMVIRAFVRLEHHRIRTGLRWFETKLSIIRPAMQHYLSHPSPILRGLVQSSATA